MPRADLAYSQDYYCSLCDKYFPTIGARADHLQYATNHPQCEKCKLRFYNLNALRNVRPSLPTSPLS